MKYILINLFVVFFIYLLDTFVFNQGIISILISLVIVSVFFILTVIALIRKNKGLVMFRLTVIIIYILMVLAVSGSLKFMNNLALSRAERLIKACNDYKVKYHKFPDRLEDLVPEFMPNIPPAKNILQSFFGRFNYEIDKKGNALLWYTELPPFGRAFYDLNRGKWSYLD
jgi:hypothetical protein